MQVLAAVLVTFCALTCAFDCPSTVGGNYKLTQSQAMAKLSAASVPVVSSGNCITRSNPTCTSLDQINLYTIGVVVSFKALSGCPVTVTGGTETGHENGVFSHYNGYKVDISMNSCITAYVQKNMRAISSNVFLSNAGNYYFYEGNHWDVTVCQTI